MSRNVRIRQAYSFGNLAPRCLVSWNKGTFDFDADLTNIPFVKLELPLEQMSIVEKLQAMEELWADLSRRAPDEVVPLWHASVLAEREQRLASGQEAVLDWDQAKRQLRQEFREGKDS